MGELAAKCQGGAQEEVRNYRQQRSQRPEQLPRHPSQTPGSDQGGPGPQNNITSQLRQFLNFLIRYLCYINTNIQVNTHNHILINFKSLSFVFYTV